MIKNANVNKVDQFQRAFCELHGDEIQQLIIESRQEAFAQAKKILKERTLNLVMQTIAGSAQPAPPVAIEKKGSSPFPKVIEKNSVDSRLNENHPHRPALGDRILEEIEAIREQILRNEELLSQIKPLLGSQQATDDKR